MDGIEEEQKSVVKGTFWGLAGSIALKLVSFIYVIIVARLFSQNDVGTFYLALSVLGMMAVFSDMGFGSAFLRYVPFYVGKGQNGKAYALLRTGYLFSGLLTIIATVAVFLLAGQIGDFFRNPGLALPLRILSIYFLANTFFSLNACFLSGRKLVKENNILNTGQNVLKLVITLLLFVALGGTIEALAVAFAASFVIVALASFLYVGRDVGKLGIGGLRITFAEQFAMLKEVLPFGLVLSLVLSFWIFVSYTDKVMLAYLLPEAAAAVAVYAIATALAGVIAIFPGAVVSIFFPVISELHGKGKKDEMLKLSVSAARWIIFLTAPLTIVFVAYPEEILQMFYGASYAAGALVLAIFSIGMFVRSLSQVQSSIIAASRLVRIELYAAGGAAAANITLNWMLIPVYGIDGAAAASAISFTIVTVLLVYYCWKRFGLGFPKKLYAPLAAVVIAVALMLALRGWTGALTGFSPELPLEGIWAAVAQKAVKLAVLGALFAASGALYFSLLMALGAIKKEDVSLLSSGLRRMNAPAGFIRAVERIMGFGTGQE
ncbi:MAG: flippase [Candidatus ainarchaeum sp.]|nr:flippase [Candidatus ainarchaeum sp.]MDD5096264.1 flippase [Candidatus ainarchaeum sp.]